jgi:hypothetical protein
MTTRSLVSSIAKCCSCIHFLGAVAGFFRSHVYLSSFIVFIAVLWRSSDGIPKNSTIVMLISISYLWVMEFTQSFTRANAFRLSFTATAEHFKLLCIQTLQQVWLGGFVTQISVFGWEQKVNSLLKGIAFVKLVQNFCRERVVYHHYYYYYYYYY